MKKTTDIALILQALEFASIKHKDQRRKDAEASPYINHPIALAKVLCIEGGIADAKVICGALLHDTIEDTQTTAKELQAHFGKAISKIVLEVTDDKNLPKEERKLLQIEHARHASKRAKLVKLADKISNLRDLVTSPPPDWSIQRKQDYFDWAKQVVDQIRAASKKLSKVFDEVYSARPKNEMTTMDKVASVFKDKLGEFGREEIIDLVVSTHKGTKRGSVIPSDYCYNAINKDPTSFKLHLFEMLGNGRYECLGQGYAYTGAIYWNGEQVGEWKKGKPKLRKDPRNYQ